MWGIMMTKILNWVAEKHWCFIGGLIIFVIFKNIFCAQEFPISLFDLFINCALLITLGVAIDFLLRIIASQTKNLYIYEFKQKKYLEFSGFIDWHELVFQIARFPSTIIAGVQETSLFIIDIFSNQFKLESQWVASGEHSVGLQNVDYLQICLGENPDLFLMPRQCDSKCSSEPLHSQTKTYCLPFRYGCTLVGLLIFKLKVGEILTKDYEVIFKSIGDVFGSILKRGLELKRYIEMIESEAALTERRDISHFLHDHLGQNLGYLHLKLDQITSNENKTMLSVKKSDLNQISNVVEESYELVRGTLENIRLDTNPGLTNLLLDYAKKISKRANFEIVFSNKGRPVSLSINVKTVVFYIFKEALCNIEKYAQAKKVNVLTEWTEENFSLTISDNGVGFDLENVNTDQHFGLEILRERIEQINGHFFMKTTENSGTTLFICVPFLTYH
jgi:signal transduction histidine kinase